MDLSDPIKNKIIQSLGGFKHFLANTVNTDLEELYNFLNKVPVFIVDFVQVVEQFCGAKGTSRQQYFSIVVYLTQLCSSYELFKNVYSEQLQLQSVEKEIIFEIKRCVSKQLTMLLDKAECIFNDTEDTTVGSFLNLMDMALDKIADIDIMQDGESLRLELNAISCVIEEILCLSMSVAQVAFGDDNKIITASCRSVLNTVENLKSEVNQESPNMAMCNLGIDTCSETLCAFEAKVNTAVLRLSLKVFSDYKKPLQNLYECCADLNKLDNAKLESLISEFDLHMDRIFQIGLFSIASSAIGKGVADIKNILSNLEFLEGELVPAFIAMTKDPLLHRKAFADVLKKLWNTQVKLLRKVVHSIIEPSAYCKLVFEELKQKVEQLWQYMSDGNNLKTSMLDPFLFYTKELGQVFNEGMEFFDSRINENIKKQLCLVHKVLNELTAAGDLLLNENAEASNQRVFKRCQVLLVTIKQLWLSTTESTLENQTVLTVKANALTEQSTSKSIENDPVLESIINKSKLTLKDRSICHLNQTTFPFNCVLQESVAKLSNETKLSRLIKNNNLRECSYRQNKTFVAGSGDFSIANEIFPRLEELGCG